MYARLNTKTSIFLPSSFLQAPLTPFSNTTLSLSPSGTSPFPFPLFFGHLKPTIPPFPSSMTLLPVFAAFTSFSLASSAHSPLSCTCIRIPTSVGSTDARSNDARRVAEE